MNDPSFRRRRPVLGKIMISLLLGVILGGSLVYYYAVLKTPTKVTPVAKTPVSTTSATVTTDVTASWTPLTSPDGHFSLRYNPTWKSRTCTDNPQTVYLAPSPGALGVCNSGIGGQMMVTSAAGDQRSSYRYAAGYDDLVTTSVSVSGTTGERQAATVKTSAGLGPEPGTKLVQYMFYKAGRTYLATYQQTTSGAVSTDVSSDFDAMITKTFKY